jgi:hypothetical protein
MLRRSSAKVAIAGAMLSVFPTGVFQPASIIPPPGSPDFDLWRNVMREYSEEYLGNPEHEGDGSPIDYENDEPFRSLEEARGAGCGFRRSTRTWATTAPVGRLHSTAG